MVNIIVVFPKQEDALHIRNLLVRNGHQVVATCTNGTMAIQAIDQMVDSDGIVVSGFKYRDMTYSQLNHYLPNTYEMLVLSSAGNLEQIYEYNVVKVSMPIKIHELLFKLEEMETGLIRRRRKRREQPKQRTPQERQLIEQAKALLMDQKSMTEKEAHRHMQKLSMDNGTGLVETAQMLMKLYKQAEA